MTNIDEYDEKRIRSMYDEETVTKILLSQYNNQLSGYYIDQLYALKEAGTWHSNKYHRTVIERLFYKPAEIKPYLYKPAIKRYVNAFKVTFLELMYDFELKEEDISIKRLVRLAESCVEYLIPKGYTVGVSLHKIVTYLRRSGLFDYTDLYDPNGYVRITEKGLNYIDHSIKHKKVLI